MRPHHAAGILLTASLGCGLISSDVAKLTFDLPTKHYTFTAPAGVPAQKVPCGAGQLLATCPSVTGLTLSCVNALCTAQIPVTTYQTMNLKMEVPALSSVNSQTLVDITLQSLTYDIDNTTSVMIPEIDLYLAPSDVTSPSDPSAQKFGSVPAVPANSQMSGDVVKEPNADALFIMYGQNFGTSFNFIASTTVTIPSGTVIASGSMVDVTINGTVAANLSL